MVGGPIGIPRIHTPDNQGTNPKIKISNKDVEIEERVDFQKSKMPKNLKNVANFIYDIFKSNRSVVLHVMEKNEHEACHVRVNAKALRETFGFSRKDIAADDATQLIRRYDLPVLTTESQKVRRYLETDPETLTKKNIEFTSKFEDAGRTLKLDSKANPGFSITIRNQDLFESGADVIVNAANTHLGGGGGIDGAIHKRGGEAYKYAHRSLQKLFHGKYINGFAAMIPSGDIAKDNTIKNVIVVAGPKMKSKKATPTNDQKDQLYSCYYNSLVLADQQGKKNIAFPSISTGRFNFDEKEAAKISLMAIQDFMKTQPKYLKTISIHFAPKSLNDPVHLSVYKDLLEPKTEQSKSNVKF